MGSASIGQVHKGKLHDGTFVAVKIQYPDIEELFRSDIFTMRLFCKFVAPEQLIIFDEIERQFMSEFDYRQEAKQLDQVRNNMAPFSRDVVVPRPFLNLCSKNVLVMEFLDGKQLIDGIRESASVYATKQGKTLEQLERETKAKWEKEGLPIAYSGPSAAQIASYRWAVKIKDFFFNIPLCIFNWTIVPCLFLTPIPFYDSFIPLNGAMIMETLLQVHGHQLFINGFFNGDPHAGNFLLLADGRIGLIDYGQVKQLTREERLYLVSCKVIREKREKE